jgi:hypothetical protein
MVFGISVRFDFPSARDSIRVLLLPVDHVQLFRSAVLVGFDVHGLVLAHRHFFVNLGTFVNEVSDLSLGVPLQRSAASMTILTVR